MRRASEYPGSPDGKRSFAIFLVTSGVSVIANLVIRYLLSRVIFFEAAIACAYVASTAIAFVLARAFVFGGGSRWQGELGRFVLVNVLGFFQVLVFGTVLVRILFPLAGFHWHPEEVAHFIGLASLSVTSYHLHRLFSFRGNARVKGA